MIKLKWKPKQKSIKLMLLLLLFISFNGYAQRKVTGQVISTSDNQPLPGVTVLIKGTTNGAFTDVDGNYSLSVNSDNDVLVFSMVGMNSQEIKVGTQTIINVNLEASVTEVDEVVVIGYGVVKKSDLTGSVASVKGEKITAFKTANPLEALQGKIAGAEITRTSGETGEAPEIQIRGERSLIAEQGPLVIVDGIEYGTKVDINQEDIASIEVLKDGSSTAIYGSRGANGVILITTKKGTAGKSTISFSAYYGVSEAIQKVPVLDSKGYIAAKMDAYRTLSNWDRNPDSTSVFSVDELRGIRRGLNTDWQDLVLKKGVQQDYLLGFTGGNDKTNYNISLNYFSEEGVVIMDKFEKFSSRINVETKIKDKIKVGTSSILSYRIKDGEGPNFTNAFLMPPILNPYDTITGEWVYKPNLANPRVSPMIAYEIEREKQNGRVFSTFFSEIQLFKNLSFRTNIGVDIDFENNGKFSPTFENYGQIMTSPIAEAEQKFFLKYTWNNILNYQKQFGNVNLNATAVQELWKSKREEYKQTGTGQLFERLAWHSLAGSPDKTVYSNLQEQSMLSYLGRINISILDKYIFQVSGRYDGASQLSEGNKWDFFPAASFAWRLNKDFLKDISVVTDLKLRIGVGKSGNAAVEPYQTKPILNYDPLYYEFGEPGSEDVIFGYRPLLLASKNLTWETTEQLNTGIDLGLFKNRLTASIDYFWSHTYDLLLFDHLPEATGYDEITANAGETKTKGIDLTLSSTNIDAGGFTWTTDLTYSSVKEEIVALASKDIKQDVGNGWFVGNPIHVWYDYKKIGIWQTEEDSIANLYGQARPGDIKFQDFNNDTTISVEDKTIIGTPRPDWSGELNNKFSYKGLEFSFNIYGSMGQMVFQQIGFDPRMLNNALKVDYWTPENPTNEYPRYNQAKANITGASTLQYLDGSYLKIKHVTLGYTLPKKLSSKLSMDKLHVYVSVKNPFLLYSKMPDGFDPEQAGKTTFPLARTTFFGINVQF